MSENPVQHKTWNTAATFSTYEEAAVKKNEILDKHDIVKIHRAGKGGKDFKVKTWSKPLEKVDKKKKSVKVKKGINSDRKKKNDNKKVRIGRKK